MYFFLFLAFYTFALCVGLRVFYKLLFKMLLVSSIFRSHTTYFIGLATNNTCLTGENNEVCRSRWRWLDGSPLPVDGYGYQEWQQHSPSRRMTFSEYKCGVIYFHALTNLWLDGDCDYPAAYICRRGTRMGCANACTVTLFG